MFEVKHHPITYGFPLICVLSLIPPAGFSTNANIRTDGSLVICMYVFNCQNHMMYNITKENSTFLIFYMDNHIKFTEYISDSGNRNDNYDDNDNILFDHNTQIYTTNLQ